MAADRLEAEQPRRCAFGTSPSARMRARRRRGLRVVAIEVAPAELVRGGFLAPEEVNDRDAIRRAAQAIMTATLAVETIFQKGV